MKKSLNVKSKEIRKHITKVYRKIKKYQPQKITNCLKPLRQWGTKRVETKENKKEMSKN